ncbi:unnamed protein product, partial [Rhizoctonia solani]
MRHFNVLRVIRENWFFFSTVALLAADISGIVIFTRLMNKYRPSAMKYNDFDSANYDSLRDFRMCLIIISRCSLSLVNEVFLSTYGFAYTNTITGTFLFQQWIYYPIIILLTALGCWLGRPFHPDQVFIEWSQFTLPLGIRGACDLLVSTVLWCLLFRTKDFKDRKSNYLSTNVEELASGMHPIPRDTVTWRGIKRRRGMRSTRARFPKMICSLAYNSLFRRVPPVETRRQVLFQNIFSLVAVALLIARAVTELQKVYGNLPSRMLVEPCRGSFNPNNNHTLFFRLPHLRGVMQSTQFDISPYIVNASATYKCNVGVT